MVVLEAGGDRRVRVIQQQGQKRAVSAARTDESAIPALVVLPYTEYEAPSGRLPWIQDPDEEGRWRTESKEWVLWVTPEQDSLPAIRIRLTRWPPQAKWVPEWTFRLPQEQLEQFW